MEGRGDVQETTRFIGDVDMLGLNINWDSFHSKINHLSFKSEKTSQTSHQYWERIPNFRTLV